MANKVLGEVGRHFDMKLSSFLILDMMTMMMMMMMPCGRCSTSDASSFFLWHVQYFVDRAIL